MSSQYDQLLNTLNGFAEKASKKTLTLGQALDSLHHAAYALISLIIVLPFIQPIPLGPLTILGGVTFMTLGWQLWRGNHAPVLPAKIRAVEMSEKTWRILAKVSVTVVKVCQKITKPRLSVLVDGIRGEKIGAAILMLAGLLMALPFAVLPGSNMLPGLAILFYCIAQFEDDGLMIIIAIIWLVITMIYMGLFIYASWHFITEASHYFANWLGL